MIPLPPMSLTGGMATGGTAQGGADGGWSQGDWSVNLAGSGRALQTALPGGLSLQMLLLVGVAAWLILRK